MSESGNSDQQQQQQQQQQQRDQIFPTVATLITTTGSGTTDLIEFNKPNCENSSSAQQSTATSESNNPTQAQQSQDKEDNKNTALLNYIVYTEEFLEPKIQKENHLRRLQNLRRELNFIKETEWMYDPIE